MLPQSREISFLLSLLSDLMPLARQIQRELGTGKIAKSDASPVTIADFTLQAMIAHRFDTWFPGQFWAGEESSGILRQNPELLSRVGGYVRTRIPEAADLDVCNWIDRGNPKVLSDRFWVVDPIDGTKGFLRGDQYAIALALIEGGQVILSGLGCPELGHDCLPKQGSEGIIVLAQRDHGAWVYRADGKTRVRALQVSSQTDISEAVSFSSVEPGHTNMEKFLKLKEKIGMKTSPLRMDSLAKYAALASGNGDFFVYFQPVKKPDYRAKLWDVAPGALIVEEAGGSVSDINGRPLDYSQGLQLEANQGLLLSNGKLHAVLVAAISETLHDSAQNSF